MRPFLATMSPRAVKLASALMALCIVPLSSDVDASGLEPSAPAASSAPACGSSVAATHQTNRGPDDEASCEPAPRTPQEIAEARTYLIETADPGYTMSLQGAELAIGRLHPEFAVRLANAIREARSAGLPFAGIFSAYRPPAFGVGGFSDKFNSLHTYGLAVDMRGIGRPGSPESQWWHEIAARNGVVCPYGPRDRTEWNHCQPTSVKIIMAENPQRETVSAAGPFDLENMFAAGNPMIEDIASAADSFSKAEPAPAPASLATGDGLKPTGQRLAGNRTTKRHSRAVMARAAAKSVRHAKHRAGARSKPMLAVEEGRRRSKSGRG